jgi:hypothetical protein
MAKPPRCAGARKCTYTLSAHETVANRVYLISGSRRLALQSVVILKPAPSGYSCIERHVVGFLNLTHPLWIQASAACLICATSFGMPLFSTGTGPLDTPGLELSTSSSYHRDSGSGLLSEAARTCSYSMRKPNSSRV